MLHFYAVVLLPHLFVPSYFLFFWFFWLFLCQVSSPCRQILVCAQAQAGASAIVSFLSYRDATMFLRVFVRLRCLAVALVSSIRLSRTKRHNKTKLPPVTLTKA